VEFINEAFQFQHTCWKKHDITVRPLIIYIYLCGDGMQPVYCILSNLLSVTVHDLN